MGRPADVIPQFGGLEVSVSSTAFMSLKDAVVYLSKLALFARLTLPCLDSARLVLSFAADSHACESVENCAALHS